MAHDVFISYSSKDKQAAAAVCARLESENIKCWIAPRDIPPSARYAQSIIGGINGSRLMIFIFSSHSNDSEHVESEIDRAYNKRLPIIPLRIEDVALTGSLEYYLSTAQWFDAVTPPLDAHLERLAGVIRQLLETKTDAAPVASAPRPPPAVLPPPKTKFFDSTALKITAGLVLIGIIAAFVFLWQRKPKNTDNQANAQTNNQTNNQAKSDKAVTSSDSIVVDSRNKLMWTKRDNGADINWNNAVKYCQDLSLGGYDDWEQPSKLDLYATTDQDISESNRVWKSFQLSRECCFWTSTQETADYAWAYDFSPDTQTLEKTDYKGLRTLCVRHSEK